LCRSRRKSEPDARREVATVVEGHVRVEDDVLTVAQAERPLSSVLRQQSQRSLFCQSSAGEWNDGSPQGDGGAVRPDEVTETEILLGVYSELKRIRQLLYFFAGLWAIGVVVLTFSSIPD